MTALLLSFLLAIAAVIHVPENGTLQHFLCYDGSTSGNLSSSTTLLLNPIVTHRLSGVCNISSLEFLAIAGGEPEELAVIACEPWNSTYPQATAVISFTRVANLTLKNLKFEHCGAPFLKLVDLSPSDLNYTREHSTALLFNHCGRLQLFSVSIEAYYGFALVAINSWGQSNFSKLSINTSTANQAESRESVSVGSGVLVHHLNTPETCEQNYQHSSLTFTQLRVVNNIHRNCRSACPGNVFHPANKMRESQPIDNAAGMTIIYNQNCFNSTVTVVESHFESNLGSFAGALYILHLESRAVSQTIIKISTFQNNANSINCHGSALNFYTFTTNHDDGGRLYRKNYFPLKVSDTTIEGHNDSARLQKNQHNPGPVFIGASTPELSDTHITFDNVTFDHNKALKTGSCMLATTYSTQHFTSGRLVINLCDIKASHNSQTHLRIAESTAGLFSFFNVHKVNVFGSRWNASTFKDNYGSVFDAINTNIVLGGYLVFTHNQGSSGAAMRLRGLSHLYFNNRLRSNFSTNKAKLKGGAIYSEDEENEFRTCIFQFESDHKVHDPDVTVTFKGNTAEVAGNSIYAAPVYNCVMGYNRSTSLPHLYKSVFRFLTEGKQNNLNSFSTVPSRLVHCNKSKPILSGFVANNSRNVHPGQSIQVHVAALDGNNQSVYTQLYLAYGSHEQLKEIRWFLASGQNIQEIEEHRTCTTVNATVLTTVESCPPASEHAHCKGVLLLSFPGKPAVMTIDINMSDCPMGFQLNRSTGSCECIEFLKHIGVARWGKMIKCEVNTGRIARPPMTDPWMGIILDKQGKKQFGLTFTCPQAYCNNAVGSYYDPKHSLCLQKRAGPICGRCLANYSAVFGSTICRKCSNWWLLTIPAYGIAGLLVITALYKLRLTLSSGSINAIIFFAAFANCGLYDMLQILGPMWVSRCKYRCFIYVFLSLLNLDVGFPLCFYNGMNCFWKTILHVAFPMYLLSLIALMSLVSRYSIAVSNLVSKSIVKVLVTVVHISFTRLLVTVIDVCSPAVIYTNTTNHLVWYWDGSLGYLERDHLILMGVGLAVLLIFILPYLLFLCFAKTLLKCGSFNVIILPLYDAIHSPYKENKQYWFVLRLLLMVFMYILYACLRGMYIMLLFTIAGTTTVIFTILQAYARPFKSNLINALDIWIMMLVCIGLTTTWLSIVTQDGYAAVNIVNVLSTFVLLTTIGVVTCHVLWVMGKLEALQGYTSVAGTSIATSIRRSMPSYMYLGNSSDDHDASPHDQEDFDASQLREPILSP